MQVDDVKHTMHNPYLYHPLEAAAPSLLRDKGFMLAAVALDPHCLAYAAESVRGDCDVVLAAVQRDGTGSVGAHAVGAAKAVAAGFAELRQWRSASSSDGGGGGGGSDVASFDDERLLLDD